MTTWTTRLMIAVATLAAAAVSASAQTTYKADIPMAFHAGSAQLAPGVYEFVVMIGPAGNKTVLVRKHNGSNSSMLVTVPGSDVPKEWRADDTPKLGFACVDGNCSLTRLWNGQDTSPYQFPARKLAPAEKERIAAITVALTRAD